MILDHVSHSQIEMFLRCPKQWEYRYVYGLKIAPSGALVEGKCYHGALEHNFRQKITTMEDLPFEECFDAFSDLWEATLTEEEVLWGRLSPGEVKDEGISLVRVYMEDKAPDVQPLQVEETYVSEVAGVTFLCRVDLIEAKKIVIDHKTSGKAYTQDDVDKSLQAGAAAFATGKAILYQNHVAIKTKYPRIQVLKTYRTDLDIRWWYDMAAGVVAQMKTGVAPPRPTGWWCSERFCGYWDRCRGELAKSYL